MLKALFSFLFRRDRRFLALLIGFWLLLSGGSALALAPPNLALGLGRSQVTVSPAATCDCEGGTTTQSPQRRPHIPRGGGEHRGLL